MDRSLTPKSLAGSREGLTTMKDSLVGQWVTVGWKTIDSNCLAWWNLKKSWKLKLLGKYQ